MSDLEGQAAGAEDLRPVPPAALPVYRYDPVRQVELKSDGEWWINSIDRMRGSSVANPDGARRKSTRNPGGHTQGRRAAC